MADRRDQFFERQDFGWLVLMSLIFFVLVAVGLWREHAAAWRPWQRHFKLAEIYGWFTGPLVAARWMRTKIVTPVSTGSH